jgi:glycosyltransferase involved in cell wall biosynthesis
MEWICTYLDKEKYQLSFIFLNKSNTEIENFVKERGYPYKRIPINGKIGLILAVLKSIPFLLKNKTDIIHCQLLISNVVGLFAGLLTGVKKRIFTRHHSIANHEDSPKAVFIDKIINFLATDIVSICKNVDDVLINKEHVNPKKIHTINHGFLFEEYENVSEQHINQFKEKYHINNNDIVIGVVSRYLKLKGLQYIIPAFKEVLSKHPTAKLILANALGPYKNEVHELLKDIPKQNYIEIAYERDMGAFYKSIDVYIHTPIDTKCEAFGQTYVEALIAKIPSVFSLSGIANEFIVNNRNAIVVPHKQIKPIIDAIELILANTEIRNTIVENGYNDVKERFQLAKMIIALEKLYDQ